jgi:hypothetical protein
MHVEHMEEKGCFSLLLSYVPFSHSFRLAILIVSAALEE